MFYNPATTIIAEFLANKSWVDPAIVGANHWYWYCADCGLVLVLCSSLPAQDVGQTPHTPSGQIGGKIRHATAVAGVAGISSMVITSLHSNAIPEKYRVAYSVHYLL